MDLLQKGKDFLKKDTFNNIICHYSKCQQEEEH